MVVSGKQPKSYKVRAITVGLPYKGKVKKGDRFYVVKITKKKLTKLPKLMKVRYSKKTKTLRFKTTKKLGKFAIVKKAGRR